jgi:3-oxoacyl-[acyl-carrier protein] reductase
MEISLNGRTAIITGGSKGLGFAMAETFAKAGADVAIAARTQADLDAAVKAIQASSKGKVIAVAGDVAKSEDCKRIFDETVKAFGRVDILVNNAGESRNGPFFEMTEERLREDLEQKLFAAVRLCQLAIPAMKQRKWGRVINVLNVGAKAPAAASAPTAISRAAGMTLTKILSKDGAPDNVLVNALLVGFIESDQHIRGAKKRGVPVEQYLAERTAGFPMKRAGKAQEFANIACLLASDAGSFITGTAINVDGGQSPVL